LFSPANNYLKLALQVHPDGLISERLPEGGEIHIHFQEGAITFIRGSGESVLPIDTKEIEERYGE